MTHHGHISKVKAEAYSLNISLTNISSMEIVWWRQKHKYLSEKFVLEQTQHSLRLECVSVQLLAVFWGFADRAQLTASKMKPDRQIQRKSKLWKLTNRRIMIFPQAIHSRLLQLKSTSSYTSTPKVQRHFLQRDCFIDLTLLKNKLSCQEARLGKTSTVK